MSTGLRLALRNLLKDKSYPVLSIIGLTIAFSGVFAVILWVKNELSFDKSLPDSDRIYRLTFETTYTGGNTLHFARCNEPWVSRIPQVFPQVEQLIRLESYRHTALKIGENKFYSERVFATDSNFFNVFGIKLLYGNIANVLNQPNTAVISASIAAKCFGSQDPLGQRIIMSGEYDTKGNPFTITGVMQDSPANSHIHFDVLTSFANPQDPPGWAYIYLLLKKGTEPNDILAGMPRFINDSEKTDVQKFYKPFLQKITDIHLHSNKDREVELNGNITRVYLFITIAIVLLAVTLINYYILNKARLSGFQKQISVQRIFGSGKLAVITQSMIESAICVLIATILSINIIDILGGANFSDSRISFIIGKNYGLNNIVQFIILIVFLAILTGALPLIIYLFKDKELRISGTPVKVSGISLFRSYGILITIQFCMSVILLIATLTIFLQKQFIFSTTMSRMSGDILVFKKQNWEVRGKYDVFKAEALRSPLIKSVTAAMEEPGGETLDAFQVESPDLDSNHKEYPLFVLPVDDNFLDFFNLKLVAGRNFSSINPDRKGEDYILNEAAVKKLGWKPEEAVGRRFNLKFDTPGIFFGGSVVGVVHDFTYTSVRQEIKPYALFQKPIFYLTFLVSIDSARREDAITVLKNIWEKELPDYPFQYEVLKDLYKTSYMKEISQSRLTSLFSVLSLIIICIGLYSITSELVSRKTKEIGIRKVNGGRTIDILKMLNLNFITWLLTAFTIACPLAWFTMNKWLQNFVYKIHLSWWIFVLSGLTILILTILTVSFQCWKAARRNPVETLRYE